MTNQPNWRSQLQPMTRTGLDTTKYSIIGLGARGTIIEPGQGHSWSTRCNECLRYTDYDGDCCSYCEDVVHERSCSQDTRPPQTDRETLTEQTPSGLMGTEWLDEVWAQTARPWQDGPGWNFTPAEFAALAEMHGVSAQEAARRLCGEGGEGAG